MESFFWTTHAKYVGEFFASVKGRLFLHMELSSHLVPVGLCAVSVHACFSFVHKVAKGIHLQRAVQV